MLIGGPLLALLQGTAADSKTASLQPGGKSGAGGCSAGALPLPVQSSRPFCFYVILWERGALGS